MTSASLKLIACLRIHAPLAARRLAHSRRCIDSHTTVRHHRETVDDQPAEIAQAEDAIQKNDFSSAETLLKKALER